MEDAELVQRCRQLAAQQAALQDPVRLASPLEDGEDLDSPLLDDADHWVSVYSELVEFKRDLLREIDRQAREMSAETGEQVARNRRAFVLELERIELHLDYWLGRRRQLRKSSARP